MSQMYVMYAYAYNMYVSSIYYMSHIHVYILDASTTVAATLTCTSCTVRTTCGTQTCLFIYFIFFFFLSLLR